jgi:hypothetical protein
LVFDRLIPLLMACGKSSGTLTPEMVSASLSKLVYCMQIESDTSFLTSLYKSVADTLRVVGIPALTPPLSGGLMDATKHQLQNLADKRKHRSQRPAAELEDDREELSLLEEMEEFALEDMEKLLRMLDGQHPLLIAIASVRELGINRWDSEDEGGSDG